MKKFIILLMSIVLLFSVFAMSACDSGDTGEVNSSSETSSEEESSSPGKVSRNFGGGSSSIDTETSGGNGFIPTTSSGGSGTTSVPEVSFSGESFYAPETPVPDGTSFEASLIILQISNIEVTTSNYEMAEVNIKMAEEEYNKLTPSQKAEVINYQHLVAAREALNKIKAAGVWAKFEQGVNALPAPEALKNANVDAVYAMKDLMDENKASLSQNAGFSALEAKVTNCYNKIQSSLVESTYIAQDGNGNGILEGRVTVGNKTYTETGESGLTVKQRGDEYASVPNFFNITDAISNGSTDACHIYSDKNNKDVKIWQYTNFTTFKFTTTTPGTLTLYVRPQNSKTYTITSNSGTFTYNSGETAESCYYEVPVSGEVTVTGNSQGYLIAAKFNYPNLG